MLYDTGMRHQRAMELAAERAYDRRMNKASSEKSCRIASEKSLTASMRAAEFSMTMKQLPTVRAESAPQSGSVGWHSLDLGGGGAPPKSRSEPQLPPPSILRT